MELNSSKTKWVIGIGIGIGMVLPLLWMLLVIIYEYRTGITEIAAILSGIIGLILLKGAFPAKDGRTRTGYKGNAEFGLIGFFSGLVLIGIAYLLSLLLASFYDS